MTLYFAKLLLTHKGCVYLDNICFTLHNHTQVTNIKTAYITHFATKREEHKVLNPAHVLHYVHHS